MEKIKKWYSKAYSTASRVEAKYINCFSCSWSKLFRNCRK